MAHTVGVPKRDPCGKCQMPIFLMERMVVGGRVYHRTCLKCARCKSQLTLGNFYETEIDEQYCCETCPDEDIADTLPIILRKEEKEKFDTRSTTPPTAVMERESKEVFDTFSEITRNSIRERLAFFEKHLESSEDKYDKNETKTIVQPSASPNNTDIHDRLLENNSDSDKSTILHPGLTQFVEQLPIAEAASSRIDLNLLPSEQIEESIFSTSEKNDLDTFNTEIHSNILEKTDNREGMQLVTKEEALKEYEDVEEKSELKIGSPKRSSILEDRETTERLNIVRSRLELFDNILEKSNDCIPEVDDFSADTNQNSDEQNDVKIGETEQLSENRSNEDGLETIINTSDEDLAKLVKNKDVAQNTAENDDKETGFESDMAFEDVKVTSEDTDDTSTTTIVSSKCEETFDKLGNSEVIETSNNLSLPSNNNNRNTIKDKELKEEEVGEKETFSGQRQTGADKTPEPEQVVSEPLKVVKSSIEDYPKDLDPFMSGDENEADESKEMKGSNPFDSDDDEIELEKTAVKPKSPKIAPPRPPPPRISKNPFDDDSDNNAEEVGQMPSIVTTPASLRKAPVPTPRTLR